MVAILLTCVRWVYSSSRQTTPPATVPESAHRYHVKLRNNNKRGVSFINNWLCQTKLTGWFTDVPTKIQNANGNGRISFNQDMEIDYTYSADGQEWVSIGSKNNKDIEYHKDRKSKWADDF